VTGGDHANMELEIGVAARFEVGAQIALHAQIGLFDPGEISGGRAFGRKRRRRGLDDPPRFDQARDQRFVVPDVRMPGENLRIEQIPIVPVPDPHAHALPRLQQPLCRKDLDR
jgi:hypothetical protein